MKIKNIKEILILIIIFTFSFVLRFYKQSQLLECLHRDEVQFNYNAYSILKTGKDEWGQTLPLHFKFNGEGHVSAIFYLGALAMSIFGPVNYAIRIPSIVLGSMFPIIVYFLILQIFKNKKLGIITAFVLALNPWQIINARMSGEISILSLFFGILGLLFLIKSISQNTKIKNLLFIFSILSFFVSYNSYIASRLDIPLLLIIFILIYWKKLKTQKIKLFFIIISIILPFLLVSLNSKRFTGTSIVAKHFFPEDKKNQIQYQQDFAVNKSGFVKTHTKDLFFEFIDNYFDYFNPYYIFRNLGEPIRTNINEIGPLYLIEFITIIFGIIFLLKYKKSKFISLLIIWLFISPISGALTYNYPDRPNSERTVYFYFILSLISGFGLYYLYELKTKKVLKILLSVSISILFLFNFAFFLKQLFVYAPINLSKYRDCAFPEIVKFTEENKDKYQNILIGTEYDYPYTHFLWQTRYSPAKFHDFIKNNPQNNSPVFIQDEDKHNWQFDKYIFIHRYCLFEKIDNTLLIGKLNLCSEKYQINIKKDPNSDRLVFLYPNKDQIVYKFIKNIKLIDGQTEFTIYSYSKDLDNPISQEDIENFEDYNK